MPQNSSYQFLHKRLSLLPSVCGIIYGSPPMAMGGMASVERKSLSTEQVISQELEKEVCYWFDMLYSVYGASITAEQAEASMAASSMLELCTPEWTPPLSSCHLTGDSSEKHNGLIQGTCELQPTVSPAESRVEGRSHLQEKTESDCNSESGEVG
ncbi:protein vac14, partial [Cystoisospora suis]